MGPKRDALPDNFTVVKGGASGQIPLGEDFSASAGEDLAEASTGVPHNQIRVTTAGDIREAGGIAEYLPEENRSGTYVNNLHANIFLPADLPVDEILFGDFQLK